MRNQLVLPLQAHSAADPVVVGAKAAGLICLLRHKFPIPPGYCLFPTTGGTSTPVLRGLPPDFQRAVSSICDKLKGLVAVRSSLVPADPPARKGPTYLGIHGEEAVARAVARCLDSLQSNETHIGPIGKAGFFPVIVQQLVDAVASGTAVTRNVETGDENEILIEARWGIGGSSLVKQNTPDLFRLRKYPLLLLTGEAASQFQEVRAGPVGLVRRPLPQSRRMEPALSTKQALALARLVRSVEEKVGYPVEVEWALTKRRFYLLQLDPAPVPSEDHFYLTPETAGGEGETLGAINAVEVPAEVLSPLGWDLISRAADAVWHDLLRLTGPLQVKKTPPLSLVAGRVYFNTTDVAVAFEQSLGSARGTLGFLPCFRGEGRKPAGWVRRCLSRLRLGLYLVTRLPGMLGYKRRLSLEHLQVFMEEIEEECASLDATVRETCPSDRLRAALDEVDSFILDRLELFVAPQLESYRFQRFLSRLRRWCGPGSESMGVRLVAGLGTMDSACCGYDLWALARQLKTRFPNLPPETPDSVVNVIDNPGDGSAADEIAATLAEFQSSHGHHCLGELDPATPRWGEDVAAIAAEIAAFMVVSGETGPEEHRQRQTAARSMATAWVDGRLSSGWRRMLFWRQKQVRRLYGRFFRSWPLIENAKLSAVKLLWRYRRLVQLAGRRLAEEGLLGDEGDIFLLRAEEIRLALSGGMQADLLADKTARRAKAQDYYRTLSPPNFIRGPYRLDGFAQTKAARFSVLTGLGVSPGRCRGRARIVRAVEDRLRFRPGEILVVSSVDAGWAPLMLRAQAIVTELGGGYSTAAVIAREYGLPAVVGIKDALSCLRDGDEILVDGETGRIETL